MSKCAACRGVCYVELTRICTLFGITYGINVVCYTCWHDMAMAVTIIIIYTDHYLPKSSWPLSSASSPRLVAPDYYDDFWPQVRPGWSSSLISGLVLLMQRWFGAVELALLQTLCQGYQWPSTGVASVASHEGFPWRRGVLSSCFLLSWWGECPSSEEGSTAPLLDCS